VSGQGFRSENEGGFLDAGVVRGGGLDAISVRSGQTGGGEDGVAHAVQKLFVIRADRGERASAGDGFFADEVIRAEADASAHRLRGGLRRCPERLFDEAAGMEFLEDVRAVVEIAEGAFEFGLPFILREVGATTTPRDPQACSENPLIFMMNRRFFWLKPATSFHEWASRRGSTAWRGSGSGSRSQV